MTYFNFFYFVINAIFAVVTLSQFLFDFWYMRMKLITVLLMNNVARFTYLFLLLILFAHFNNKYTFQDVRYSVVNSKSMATCNRNGNEVKVTRIKMVSDIKNDEYREG